MKTADNLLKEVDTLGKNWTDNSFEFEFLFFVFEKLSIFTETCFHITSSLKCAGVNANILSKTWKSH